MMLACEADAGEGPMSFVGLNEVLVERTTRVRLVRLDVRDVAWHSVYEVGHRLTDRFDDVPAGGPTGAELPAKFLESIGVHGYKIVAGEELRLIREAEAQ